MTTPCDITIPFCIGAEHSPDLGDVAAACGLSTSQAIASFIASEFRAAFIGFAPGFAYLDGLSPALRIERLATPRTRVPAGSVAIAGDRAGIYPFEMPGGWRLLGRTPLKMFDPTREHPSLIRSGDRVRFVQIDRAEFERLNALELAAASRPASHPLDPALRIVHPGAHSSIQDLGRTGHGNIGVPISGSMDTRSLIIANRLLGNPDTAAAIECAVGGLTIEFMRDASLAFGGADAPATLTSASGAMHEIPPWRAISVRPGERVRFGVARTGHRIILALGGGIDVAPVLGSRSTLALAGFGGHEGRALRAGDQLSTGTSIGAARAIALPPGFISSLRFSLNRRVLRATRDAAADPALARAFFASTFRVMPRSDRSGVRLDPGGPLVPAELADAAASRTLISRRVGPGTIQCPSASEAIALAADGPTTGGYAVVACVATVDLPAMGQVRPGEFVRFEEVSAAEADTLLASQRDWMSAALPSAISR
jgi:biotin-dependent carboxylase-like uncharacterized protein